MTKNAGAKKEFKCKLCDKAFERGPGLGSHMRIVHGIAGMAKSTVAAREKSKANTPAKLPKVPVQQNLGGPTPCPECGITAANKAALANHRRAAHGVKSNAQVERERRAAKLLPPPPPTDLTSPTKEKIIEQRRQEPQVIGTQIDPFLFAYAVGEIKERCRSIAEEHDVPTKLFTRQFAELFLREARR